MRRTTALRFVLVTVLLVSGCAGERAESAALPSLGDTPHSAAMPATPPTGWRAAPTEGVRLSGLEPLIVETEPHVVLWPEESTALEAPYRVEAHVEKLSGRLYEGYGIVFGGDPLDAPESEQRYAYFLVRGDGAFLVKRREFHETPVVKDWTAHAAVNRDGDQGASNHVAVEVRADSVFFLVNGTEVSRLPADQLRISGVAGLRVAHHVRLAVRGFTVTPNPLPE
jgi:hypothetical protein